MALDTICAALAAGSSARLNSSAALIAILISTRAIFLRRSTIVQKLVKSKYYVY